MSRLLTILPVPDGDSIGSVPWSMVEPHESQVFKNHGHSLEEIQADGGLDILELLAVLDGRAFPKYRTPEEVKQAVQYATQEVARRVKDYTAGAQPDCALKTTAVAAVVWSCVVCSTEQVARTELPQTIPCRFCRAVHMVTPAE